MSRLDVGLMLHWWPAVVGSGTIKAYLALIPFASSTPQKVNLTPEKSIGALMETLRSPPPKSIDNTVVSIAFLYKPFPSLSKSSSVGVTPKLTSEALLNTNPTSVPAGKTSFLLPLVFAITLALPDLTRLSPIERSVPLLRSSSIRFSSVRRLCVVECASSSIEGLYSVIRDLVNKYSASPTKA